MVKKSPSQQTKEQKHGDDILKQMLKTPPKPKEGDKKEKP